jgi:hypothetical protein
MSHQFPVPFADLESVADWALATEAQRARKRRDSSMAEIRSFYDVILPRMDAIIEYLDQFPLDNMPADAQRLLHLTLSLAEVATAVELFNNPIVPGGYDPERFVPPPGQ